jgi:hypothetical membrane protein
MALGKAQIRIIGGYCGIVAVIAFVSGVMASAVTFPGFSLSDVWTSDLGDYGRNPQGAIFYNAGGAIAGLLFVPFATGIGRWYELAKSQKFFYDIAMHFGLLASLGMVMQSIFSRGTDLHTPWSTVTLFSMTLVLLFAYAAFRRNPAFYRPISYLGVGSLLTLLAFFALYALDRSPVILEWLAVFSYFLWALVLSANALNNNVTAKPQRE